MSSFFANVTVTNVTDVAAALKNARQVLDIVVAAMIDFPKPLAAGVNGPAVGVMVTTLAIADVVW